MSKERLIVVDVYVDDVERAATAVRNARNMRVVHQRTDWLRVAYGWVIGANKSDVVRRLERNGVSVAVVEYVSRESRERVSGTTPPAASDTTVAPETSQEEIEVPTQVEVEVEADATNLYHAPTDDGRRYDRTQLRAKALGYTVHRDYAAHFFRWGWARRWIKKVRGDDGQWRRPRVLDVGCGQDLALLRVIRSYPQGDYIPELYCGVDLNQLEPFWRAGTNADRWCKLYSRFSFVDDYAALVAEHGLFDLVVCFEVIEHMPPADGARLLTAIRACLTPNGRALLSTPVFNGSAARNHVHEYTVDELYRAVRDAELTVVERFGTFASYPDIKRALIEANEDDVLAHLNGIRAFYSDEVAACFLAPLYPDASRNNAWVLRRLTADDGESVLDESEGWALQGSTVREAMRVTGGSAESVAHAAPLFMDVENLAGTFTLGAVRAGWQLAGARRMPGAFGLACVESNRHLVGDGWEAQVGSWEGWEPGDGIGAVFATPPCAGFSALSRHLDESQHGVNARQNACMHAVAAYAARCRGTDGRRGPELVIFESVRKAGIDGRPLMCALRDVLTSQTGERYQLTHVFQTHAWAGGAQRRPRYLFVAHRIPFAVGPRLALPTPAVADVIDDLRGLSNAKEAQPYVAPTNIAAATLRRPDGLVTDHHWAESRSNAVWLTEYASWPEGWLAVKLVREGPPDVLERLEMAHAAAGLLPRWRAERRTWFGGPSRLAADKPCRVLTGSGGQEIFHYAEPRPLSVRECGRLMGMPDSWSYGAARSVGQAYAWIGKSLPLQPAEWVATWALRALAGELGPWTGVACGEDEFEIDVTSVTSEVAEHEGS